MWGKRHGKAPGGRRRFSAFLDEGSDMEGRYTCTGTVVINAKFKGDITSRDTLIIGDEGFVQATVHTESLVVRGALVGDVVATGRVELKRGARVTGDIEAPVVVMEEGAVHDGLCRMTKAKSAEATLSVVVPIKA